MSFRLDPHRTRLSKTEPQPTQTAGFFPLLEAKVSLRTTAEAVSTTRPATCTVSIFLSTLTDAQANEFRDLLPELSGPNMSRAILAEYKYRLSSGAILRHRRGECTCDTR